MSDTALITYSYPPGWPRSEAYRVLVNGRRADVASTGVGDFVSLAFQGAVEVEVESDFPLTGALLQPVSRGIRPVITANKVNWQMTTPANLCLQPVGQKPLFFYASAPAPAVPTTGVCHFRGGQVHDVGELELHDGETLYIEGGAVVRGCVRVTGASDVRIAGHGILDGELYRPGPDARRSIILDNCRNCRIEDIIMVRPSAWMIVIGGSQDITVRGVRQLGECLSSDGVDVVGSQRVWIEDCFLRNGDDSVVIKALEFRADPVTRATTDWRQNVEDVVVRRCALLSYSGAAAMEIGYETRCDAIRRISFTDCDVLGVHQGFGAPFGIHNGDHATVSDVLWEDIRVEHYYGKLVDFRIMHSRYSKDAERGHVRGITLRRVRIQRSRFNAGYTVSLIGGYDAGHRVEDVVFEDFQIDGQLAHSGDALDLHTRHAGNITFR